MHYLVRCRKWFFNQILLCQRGLPGVHMLLAQVLGCPWVRFVQGGLCRGCLGADLPARHLIPSSSRKRLQPSPVRSAPQPRGLLRHSQLTGDSAVFQPGCLIHLWGRLAGVPLLLLPEADVSAGDQREGKSVFPEVPWSLWLHRAISWGSSSLHAAPSLCCQSHWQSLEYLWKGPGKINHGNSLPYGEK